MSISEAAVLSFHAHECVYEGWPQIDKSVHTGAPLFTFSGRVSDRVAAPSLRAKFHTIKFMFVVRLLLKSVVMWLPR